MFNERDLAKELRGDSPSLLAQEPQGWEGRSLFPHPAQEKREGPALEHRHTAQCQPQLCDSMGSWRWVRVEGSCLPRVEPAPSTE
jgi:hypothetical protein